jgi:hypothetical protein
MAQAHWEPLEPEPRVRVARLEQIPQFEWLYSRLPTARGRVAIAAIRHLIDWLIDWWGWDGMKSCGSLGWP